MKRYKVKICISKICHFDYIIENQGYTPHIFPVDKSYRTQKLNVTEFNAAFKAIISVFNTPKAAKRSEIHLKQEAAGHYLPFLRVF